MTKPVVAHTPLELPQRKREATRRAGSKGRTERHSRNLFRAATIAARTHSGAVPP
jgi:hypothetical protein